MPTTTYPTPPSFAAYALQDRSDAAGADVTDLNATDLRVVAALHRPGFNRGAYRPTAGAGMQVLVGTAGDPLGVAVIAGQNAGQGNYVVGQAGQHAIPVPTAEVGNIRNDEVYLLVADSAFDAGSLRLPRYAYRKGDPGGALPGPDSAWKAHLIVCQINLPAGASTPTVIDKRTHTGALGSTGLPIGGGFLWFAGTAPIGCIFARGQTELITTYPELYELWGTNYGGDGLSTFGVPDLRQRFPLGRAASGTGVTLRSTGGQIDHTHNENAHTHSDPAHGHTVQFPNNQPTSNAPSHNHDGATTGATKGTYGGHTFDGSADEAEQALEHRHGIVTEAAHGHTVNFADIAAVAQAAHNVVADPDHETGTKNPPYLVVEYAVVAN